MSAIEITIETVEKGLRALVDQYGENFVYDKHETECGSFECTYVRDGQADCIVGKFLVAQGVPLERLAEADLAFHGAGLPADCLLSELRHEGCITISGESISALKEVQYQQDDGNPWGVAVRRALQNI